tara:strand:+ start:1234 stop:2580 length:1347 start_codon:yes stop_codon:yes gene_type:complete
MNGSEAIQAKQKNDRTTQLYEFYAEIERRTRVDADSIKTTYRSPVNFIESLQQPRHRWFPYKEGFSPSFVRSFLNDFDTSEKGLVFDPFAGSGTTAIVAGEQGRHSVGFEVSPLTSFVAKTKTIVMDKSELKLFKSLIDDFEQSELKGSSNAPQNDTVKRYFSSGNLEAVLRVKKYFHEITNQKHQDLFKLAYLSAIEPFSTHRKAGNGVKRKTKEEYPGNLSNPILSLKNFMLSKLAMFEHDIASTRNFVGPEFRQSSSLDESQYVELEEISTLLTSPPYANCFDYSKIYMSELWLGDFFESTNDQKKFRQTSVRSHVHAHWDDRNETFGSQIVNDVIRHHIEGQELWSPRIGSMLSGYFQDLGKLLATVKPHLKRGAHLGFVVGNSFYGGIAVATDLLLADLAAKQGYTVDSIKVYRGVIPSSQQYKLLGENRKYMRESLVILRND